MLYLCLTILLLNHLELYFVQLVENEDHQFQTPKLSLERQIKNKFTLKKRSNERFRKLNERLARDTEYFEEIPHFASNSSESIKSKQGHIESDFKKLIGMVGFKYTYKRDLYWRTWRKVNLNKTEIICYRCQNVISIKNNCSNCHQGGYWVIEEKRPPCSFSILSFKNENELCVADFWQLNTANLSSCPTVIPFDDLSKCGIPIITNFLATKDYTKPVSERPSAVCQGRDRCDISTVYIIRPKSIVFRIINATNNVVYSRIMKQNGTSYVCVKDCGIYDFLALSAKRNEDHLSLDLLSSIKKKRHSLNHRQDKKVDTFEFFKSKRPFSEKFIVKKHEYILEQPIESRNNDHKPSMCKQILLKELMKQEG